MADNNQSSGKTGSLLDSGEPKTACCCLSRRLSRGNFEKLFVLQLDTGGKVGGLLLFFCFSSGKKKKKEGGPLD